LNSSWNVDIFQKIVTEKIETYISCSKTFSENRAVYERMWGKYGRARQATDDNTILLKRFACRITKAADTHS
jgi:hypothetical protein